MNTGISSAAPRRSASRRRRALADTPPAMPTERAPYQRAAANVRSTSVSTTRHWKLAAMSCISASGRLFGPERRLARAHVSQHRGLEAGEAEVESAVTLGRVAVGIGQPGARPANRRERRPRGRQPIDDRPARIPEPQQLRHLVVRLARRIVTRAAEETVVAFARHQVEVGVTAGDHQHDRRQRDARRDPARSIRCAPPGDGPPTSGLPSAHAAAFANDTPTSSEPTRPGPWVTATASTSGQPMPASRAHARRPRRCRGRAAGRPAPARRRPTRGGSRPATRPRSSASPRPLGVARPLDDGGRGFVARGFDPRGHASGVTGCREVRRGCDATATRRTAHGRRRAR